MIQNDMALLAWQIFWSTEVGKAEFRDAFRCSCYSRGWVRFFSTVFVKITCRIAMNSPRSGAYFSSRLLSIEGEDVLHRARQERERFALGPSVVSGQEIWGKWVAALSAWHVEVSVCLITR